MRFLKTLVLAAAGGLALCAFALTAGVLSSPFAFAQDATTVSLIDQACADHGALLKWAVGIFGTSTLASLLANFRSRLPAGVVKVLDVAGLNLFALLKAAAQQAPKAAPVFAVFVLGCFLGACQITGNLSADTDANLAKLQAFAPQVQAYNADALSKISAFNQGALTDAVAVGKSVCGDASMLDGAFKLAAPAMAVAGVDPKVGVTEAGVMLAVNLNCKIVDAADPSNPPATLASAVAAVVQALPQLKSALAQTGSAPAEAAASVPAAAAS